jgi:hypothetical protein
MILALIGDARVMRFGVPRGGPRLARHLWRMCFALFIAAGSFFSVRERVAKILPEPFTTAPMRALPILLLFAAMFYWLWRVRGRRRLPALRGFGVSPGAPVETGMALRGESPRRERSSEPLVPESCGETVRPSRSVDRGTCGPGMGSRKDRLESADAIQDWRKAAPSEPLGARLVRALRDLRPRARREASCLGTGRSHVRLRGRVGRPRQEARRA